MSSSCETSKPAKKWFGPLLEQTAPAISVLKGPFLGLHVAALPVDERIQLRAFGSPIHNSQMFC